MARYIALVVLGVFAELLTTPVASYASVPISVPEPTTLALVGVGVGVAGVAAWVKGRRKK